MREAKIKVEMLTQTNCEGCEKAKSILQENGFIVAEFSQLEMYERNDRVEVMAALAENNCSFPIMRHPGSSCWTGDVQEIIHSVRNLQVDKTRTMAQAR